MQEVNISDIDKDTVDFQDNYDGKDLEPNVLPAQFPNLFLNGAGGIAVGMATNIPPHNLKELIEATKKLIFETPNISCFKYLLKTLLYICVMKE